MFTATLFTIAETWKQPKHLPTDELIKKMWMYTHTHTQMEYYSAIIERNEIFPVTATWMELETTY